MSIFSRGAGYRDFGGYDITIGHLEHPFRRFKLACLPGPLFDDIRSGKDDSTIAGYGRYIRKDEICQTNRFGQMKFHYCDGDLERKGNKIITFKFN